MHKIFSEDRTCSSADRLVDRQTDRHGHPYRGQSKYNLNKTCSVAVYARQAISEPPPENWRRPPGQPRTTWMKNVHDDLSSLDLEIMRLEIRCKIGLSAD